MTEKFSKPTDEDLEKLEELEEFRERIEELQEEADAGDGADADYYLNQVNPAALGPYEAYYFKLFQEGDLDDRDLKEYKKSIKERSEDETVEDFVFDNDSNELLERKISWHSFHDWLNLSLHPEFAVTPRIKGLKKRAEALKLESDEQLIGLGVSHLTQKDKELFYKFEHGREGVFQEVKEELDRLVDGIAEEYPDPNDIPPEIYARYRFLQWLLMKSPERPQN